jgi:RNA polymerase sigma-70 factor (ECF subfamily)
MSLLPVGKTDADLNRYRGYLQVLAEMGLGTRLRGKIDPSDIVQQSLLEAHQDLPAFRGTSDAELIAWLRQILARNLLNVARDFAAQKRDLKREVHLAQQLEQSSLRLDRFLAAEQTSPSHALVRGEQAMKLVDALAELPNDQRTAIIQKHLQDRSLAEIADQMGRSTLAVAGLLKRGLKRLRTLMENSE